MNIGAIGSGFVGKATHDRPQKDWAKDKGRAVV